MDLDVLGLYQIVSILAIYSGPGARTLQPLLMEGKIRIKPLLHGRIGHKGGAKAEGRRTSSYGAMRCPTRSGTCQTDIPPLNEHGDPQSCLGAQAHANCFKARY
jgi:hypothetical protein